MQVNKRHQIVCFPTTVNNINIIDVSKVINLGSGRYIEYEPESSERYIPLEYNRDGTEMYVSVHVELGALIHCIHIHREKVEAEISISDDQV